MGDLDGSEVTSAAGRAQAAAGGRRDLSERLGDHHRLHSVRAHLLDLAGDTKAAIAEFRAAAARTTNLREQHYLITQAARLKEPDRVH